MAKQLSVLEQIRQQNQQAATKTNVATPTINKNSTSVLSQIKLQNQKNNATITIEEPVAEPIRKPIPTNNIENIQNEYRNITKKIANYGSASKDNYAEKIFKSITGSYGKEQKSKEYQKLIKKQQELRKQIEENSLQQKQTGSEKYLNTVAGGLQTGLKGIESTINKVNPFSGFKTSKDSTALTYEQKKAQAAMEQTKNPITKAGLGVVSSVSQMIPQIAVGNPAGALAVSFANYGGGAYNQAKQEGKTEAQATKYGIAIGALETTLQKALGGLTSVYGKSGLGKISDNVLKKIISNKTIRDVIANTGGEFTEEYLQDILNPVVRNITMGENNKFKLYTPQALESGILGALTAGIIETPNSLANNTSVNPQFKADTQTNVQPSTITPTTPQTTQGVAQMQPQGQTKAQDNLGKEIPTKISQADLVPKNVQSQLPNKIGSETSNLEESIQKSPIVDEAFKKISQNLTYDPISNKSTMENAKSKLDTNLNGEVTRLFNLDPERATAEDVAGLIQLQYQYQKNNDLQSFQETINKLRQIGTTSGQAVQAFAIMQHMTPDGMVYYAQKDLQNLFDEVSKNKSKQWIESNKQKYNLTDSDIQTIKDIMMQVSETENIRQRRILLAQVQKLINDKIPTNIGNEIKSFRRISMLFNPKTQIRNIIGNATILPLNVLSDKIGGVIDKKIAKATGVRTTGNYSKNYAEGFKQGVGEVIEDYKMGIDTSGIEGNRFEIRRGNNFNKDTKLGKALNKVDKLNSMMLRMGDNPFFSAEFNNSLTNQMKLNNISEPTPDMVEIATQTALERTWQDNNKYTQAVLSIRNEMNKLGFKEFGLGDTIIPFAKTPANLTKAMVDYSPVGLIKSLTVEVEKFKNNINNNTATPQMQRKLVNDISKGMSGSILYLIAFGLRNLISGGSDDDKDIRDFMKNTMGVNPYSIKINNKTYTFDWMQPVATPFSIIADLKKNKGDNIFNTIKNAFGTAGDRLIEQSFLQGISNLFSNFGSGKFENVIGGIIEDLPASFVPTLSKQINDIVDKYNRQIYNSSDMFGNAYRSMAAKTPGLSLTLPKKYDTLGEESLKYGGENNLFNVFLNPSNVNKEKNGKVSKEIMKLYENSGEKTIFPRVAPTTIKNKNKTYKLNPKEMSEYQKKIGTYSLNKLNDLFNSNEYKSASDIEKQKAIENIYNASQYIAKQQYLKSKINK